MSSPAAFDFETHLDAAALARLLAAPAEAADPALARAAGVLADPATTLVLRLWAGATEAVETRIAFPGPIAAGGGVICVDRAEGCRLRGFVEADAVLRLVALLLPPPVAVAPFATRLDADEALVLAAALDLARSTIAARIASLAASGTVAPVDVVGAAGSFTAARLAARLAGPWPLSALGDVVTPVMVLTARPTPPEPAMVAAALARLAALGLVAIEGRRARFDARVAPLLRALVGASAGFQWRRLARRDAESMVVHERIVLLGGAGVLVELTPDGVGGLRLRLVDGDTLRRELVADCFAAEPTPAPARPPIPPPEPPSPGPRFCGGCGAPHAAEARFCGRCGRKV